MLFFIQIKIDSIIHILGSKMYEEIINPPENLKQLRNQIVEADGYRPITAGI